MVTRARHRINLGATICPIRSTNIAHDHHGVLLFTLLGSRAWLAGVGENGHQGGRALRTYRNNICFLRSTPSFLARVILTQVGMLHRGSNDTLPKFINSQINRARIVFQTGPFRGKITRRSSRRYEHSASRIGMCVLTESTSGRYCCRWRSPMAMVSYSRSPFSELHD